MDRDQVLNEIGRRYIPAIYMKIVDNLNDEPYTIEDMAELLRLPRSTVGKAMKRLHMMRVIYICKVTPREGDMGGSPTATYALGNNRDARGKPPKTNAQKCRDYRQNKRNRPSDGVVRLGLWGL